MSGSLTDAIAACALVVALFSAFLSLWNYHSNKRQKSREWRILAEELRNTARINLIDLEVRARRSKSQFDSFLEGRGMQGGREHTEFTRVSEALANDIASLREEVEHMPSNSLVATDAELENRISRFQSLKQHSERYKERFHKLETSINQMIDGARK